MSLILNIRGTNGSGKSTLMRGLMDHLGVVSEIEDAKSDRVWAYELNHNIRVLGRYETACGGVDAIKEGREGRAPGEPGFRNTRKGITLLSSLGHVMFEGVLWSTVFKSSNYIAEKLPQHHFIFAMLDTPAEVCIERVNIRREASGNIKPFNPEELLSKIEQIQRRQVDLAKSGHDTRIIPYKNAIPTVLGWLRDFNVI